MSRACTGSTTEAARSSTSSLAGSSTSTPSGSTSGRLSRSCRGRAGFTRLSRTSATRARGGTSPSPTPRVIGHNDIAPYNVCFDGDDLAGVFDWDFAGPTTPLFELAFIAWNCVPLWRDIGAELAGERLAVIASTYGGFSPLQILRAVPPRIQILLDGIPLAAAAGDAGMVNLMANGEPERSTLSLADLVRRMPEIERRLTGRV